MPAFDPLDTPLGGHQGLLDAAIQSLTAAGATAYTIERHCDDPALIADLHHFLGRIGAAVRLSQEALWAGASREQTRGPLPSSAADRDYWLEKLTAGKLTETEQAVLDYCCK